MFPLSLLVNEILKERIAAFSRRPGKRKITFKEIFHLKREIVGNILIRMLLMIIVMMVMIIVMMVMILDNGDYTS